MFGSLPVAIGQPIRIVNVPHMTAKIRHDSRHYGISVFIAMIVFCGLTPFCRDDLLSALSSFCMYNLLYALSFFYMDSLYFTFTLRITAVLYKQPTLHVPSGLSPCYMTSLLL